MIFGDSLMIKLITLERKYINIIEKYSKNKYTLENEDSKPFV
jgi:hypothetical protein